MMFLKIVFKKCDSVHRCFSQHIQTETLIMAHAIFRHGDRTTITKYCYPTDPYKDEKYYPFGPGELTNQGKLRCYNLGKMLRQRYNHLLGEMYTPGLIYARSSGASRTQMSLLLVLASLFPPRKEQIWNNFLDWQPIPYESLLGSFESCPNFLPSIGEVLKSETVQEINRHYSELFNYISKNSGRNATDLFSVLFLYLTLKSEAEYGLRLPKWTDNIFPDVLKEITEIGYYLFTETTSLKQIGAGFLVQKIVEDTQAKIQGQIDTKLFLYSCHDFNIASLLHMLNVFEPHVPPYGSCVLIEIHQVNGQYGIKVFYENYEGIQTGLLTIPGCEHFCPMDKFIAMVEKYFPDENLYGPK